MTQILRKSDKFSVSGSTGFPAKQKLLQNNAKLFVHFLQNFLFIFCKLFQKIRIFSQNLNKTKKYENTFCENCFLEKMIRQKNL